MGNVKEVAVLLTMPAHRVVGFQRKLKIGPNGTVDCRKKPMQVPESSLRLQEEVHKEVHEEDVRVEQDQWKRLVHLNKNESNWQCR